MLFRSGVFLSASPHLQFVPEDFQHGGTFRKCTVLCLFCFLTMLYRCRLIIQGKEEEGERKSVSGGGFHGAGSFSLCGFEKRPSRPPPAVKHPHFCSTRFFRRAPTICKCQPPRFFNNFCSTRTDNVPLSYFTVLSEAV